MVFIKEKGSILLEAILALAITIIIITGIVSALVSSLNNSTFSKNQNRASGFAQKGLEIARNLKDSDFSSFSLLNGYYCIFPEDVTLNSVNSVESVLDCDPDIDGLRRAIYINSTGFDTKGVKKCSTVNSVFVASSVYWSDSKCDSASNLCHKVELDSCFVNLNKLDSI